MWFIYALLSALLASFRKVNDKHLSHAVHHLHLAWMMRIVTVLVTGVLALLMGQILPENDLPAAFWVSTLLCVFITSPLDTAVYLHSLKHGQLSKTAPIMSLWPVVMLISGMIFLGQNPTAGSILAVATIVAGVCILNTSRASANIFRNIWGDRGTRFALIGVGTVSANTTLEAIALLHSSPLFFAFWAGLLKAIVQFGIAQLIAPGQYHQPYKKLLAQNGLIQGLATSTYSYAVASGPIGYVAAVRSLSAPISAVVGAHAFSEGLGRRKIVALSLVAVGVVLLGIAT